MLEKKKLYKAIILREFLSLKYNLHHLIISIIASLIVFAVFLLILEESVFSNISTFYGIIIAITVVTVGLVDSIGMEEEFYYGVFEQLILLPIKPLYLILIKYLIGFFKYFSINSIIWFCISQVVGHDFLLLLIPYTLFYLYLFSVSLMVSSINLSIKWNRNAFSTIAVIPIIFPQIILSILSINDNTYIYLVMSLTIIIVPIFIIFSSIILQKTISDC